MPVLFLRRRILKDSGHLFVDLKRKQWNIGVPPMDLSGSTELAGYSLCAVLKTIFYILKLYIRMLIGLRRNYTYLTCVDTVILKPCL